MFNCVFIPFFFFVFLLPQNFIAKHPDAAALTDSFNNRLIYYTRTRGLFRYCYPKERPPASSGKWSANEQKNDKKNPILLGKLL